jgi:hypothetical protein
MSWKSLPGNQTISRSILQNAIDTGVFIVRNGVPATEPNREITKADAQNYINTWDLYYPFNIKAPNQLPVKSNLAVQSNQIYGGTDTRIYVGNTNRNWVYSIDFAGGDRIGSVASSTDNRCILYGKSYQPGAGGGGAHVSNDYGETFRRLDDVMTTNDAATSTAMSSNGELMILTRQVGSVDGDRARILRSNNAGVSWVVGYQDGVRYNFNGAAMSGAGNYATVIGSDGTNYYVFTSNTFGASYTRTFISTGGKDFNVTGCVGMSKSGQYQLLTPPSSSGPYSGISLISNDYGNSWTAVYYNPPGCAGYVYSFQGCSVSAGGDYMTVAGYAPACNQYFTFISSDFGVSWSVVSGGSYNGTGQAVDSSGQFQYQTGRASIDYGNSWYATSLFGASISVNPTTLTTPYIYGTTTGGNLYKSVDQGSSFSLISISGYFTKVATSGGSNNGKYVAAIKDNDPGGFPNYSLYQSSDYGATWFTSLFFGGQVLSCCAVSDDGVYWLAAAYDQFYTYIYRSTNSGASFQYVTQATFFAQDCAISSDGKYMTIIITRASGNGTILNSTNYGASWTGTGVPGNGLAYIAMSGRGRFRAFATNSSDGARVYYSSNYGVNFAEDLYVPDFIATSCALDDSGQVGLASFRGGAIPLATTSRIYYTTNGWDTDNYFQPDNVPVPLVPPLISGVNVSSDGTYWSAVSSNYGYSYTCTTGDGNFIARGNNNNPTFNNLSK